MAQGAGSAATRLGKNGTLGQALDSSTDAFGNLERIPGQVLTAIVQLAAAGGPLLDRITGRIADFVDSASKALDNAFESGALSEEVNEAAEAFQQLGRIVGNIFGTIGNIFSVASEQGDGLFGTLEKITQAMEDFTATEEFRDALRALIDTGAVLVDSILPVIEEAFRALLPVIEVLAPPVQELITLIGDQLATLIPELAPVLVELAEVLGVVLEAITPLIEQGINILIEIMPELVPLLQAVADLFTQLSPLIEYFAVGASALLVPALEFAIEFFTYFVLGLADIIEWVDQVIVALFEFSEGAIKTVLVPAVQIAVAVLRGDWATAWDVAQTSARDASFSITRSNVDMVQNVIAFLKDMFGQMASLGLQGFGYFQRLAFQAADYVIGQIFRLRDWTITTLYGLAGDLYNAGANMINSLARGILSQLGSAVAAAQEVVGSIRDFFPSSPAKRDPFSGRGYPLYSGQNLVEAFGRGIESRRSWLDRVLGKTLGTGTPGDPLLPSSGLFSPSMATGSAGGISSLAGLTFTRTGPSVNVYIGNDQLTGYVQTVVDEDTAQQDRLASQGVRGI
jgi:phage-related protein